MKSIFNRTQRAKKKVLMGFNEPKEVAVVDPVTETVTAPRKPGEKVYIPEVQVIHDEFNSEVDRLLAKANIDKEGSDELDSRAEKLSELSALGFGNTKGSEETGREIQNVNEAEELFKAIEHFSFTYPQYKFITEDSVKKICKKYNLIYASVRRYIGEVPDHNIKEMQAFEIKKEDKAYIVNSWTSLGSSRSTTLDYTSYMKGQEESSPFILSNWFSDKKFEIAAPVSDFNTNGMQLNDFKLEGIPPLDPIVLQPVMYKGVQHYLIVTAWGPEASDPLVVNQKMN